MAVVGVERYPAAPSSVRAARRDAADAVRGCGLGDAADGVTLLVSELVTNAVKATGNSGGRAESGCRDQVIALRLTRTPASLVIEVWDGDGTPPVLAAQDDPDAEGGRGLLLVEALSAKWGHYHPPAGGKVVWCAVELPPAESGTPTALGAQAALDRREPAAGRGAHPDGHRTADPVGFFDDLEVLRRVVAGLRALDWDLPGVPPAAVAGRVPHPPHVRGGRMRISRSLVPP